MTKPDTKTSPPHYAGRASGVRTRGETARMSMFGADTLELLEKMEAAQIDQHRAALRRLLHIPRIVCLCGSTRFGDAYKDAMRAETLAGKIVLSVGLLGHAEGIDMDGPVKVALDALHFRKIDLADEVLILNVKRAWCLNHQRWTDRTLPDGDYCCVNIEMRPYIGESTRKELEHARKRGKAVRFLEPVPESGAAI